jgi:hypothetical protein
VRFRRAGRIRAASPGDRPGRRARDGHRPGRAMAQSGPRRGVRNRASGRHGPGCAPAQGIRELRAVRTAWRPGTGRRGPDRTSPAPGGARGAVWSLASRSSTRSGHSSARSSSTRPPARRRAPQHAGSLRPARPRPGRGPPRTPRPIGAGREPLSGEPAVPSLPRWEPSGGAASRTDRSGTRLRGSILDGVPGPVNDCSGPFPEVETGDAARSVRRPSRCSRHPISLRWTREVVPMARAGRHLCRVGRTVVGRRVRW